MKAIANTTIRFGMIALPSQVVSATENNEVKLEQASPQGEKLRQVYLDPADNEVPRDEILKGIWDGDKFKAIDKAALDAIAENTKIDDLAIQEIIPATDIPYDRVTGKYYIQSYAKGGNPGAFKLFVDALEAEGMAAVTKWTARSRQKLLVMYPENGNLAAVTLSFNGDVRQPDEAVEAHKSAKYFTKELDMAREIISQMAQQSSNALDAEIDEAITLKADLLQQALAGQAINVPQKSAAQAVDSLSEALTAMLAGQNSKKQTSKAA